jgi:hypothetical protein
LDLWIVKISALCCTVVTGRLLSVGCDDSRRSTRSRGGHRGGREIKCPTAKTTNTNTSTSTSTSTRNLPSPATSTDAARKSGGHDLILEEEVLVITAVFLRGSDGLSICKSVNNTAPPPFLFQNYGEEGKEILLSMPWCMII